MIVKPFVGPLSPLDALKEVALRVHGILDFAIDRVGGEYDLDAVSESLDRAQNLLAEAVGNFAPVEVDPHVRYSEEARTFHDGSPVVVTVELEDGVISDWYPRVHPDYQEWLALHRPWTPGEAGADTVTARLRELLAPHGAVGIRHEEFDGTVGALSIRVPDVGAIAFGEDAAILDLDVSYVLANSTAAAEIVARIEAAAQATGILQEFITEHGDPTETVVAALGEAVVSWPGGSVAS